MRAKRKRKITFGDLIVAVTDQVSLLTRHDGATNLLVSRILKDLMASRRVKLRNGVVVKIV
jgi:hypothetical protein